MDRPKCLRFFGVLIAVLFVLCPRAGRAQGPVEKGLNCIATHQNPTGSWGAVNSTGLRDTTTILEVLNSLVQKETGFSQGVNFLQGVAAPNQDYLSRKIFTLERTGREAPTPLAELQAGQTSESFAVTAPNYPEGGWGVGPGFGTETLTTALALNALKAAGFSTGLAVVKAAVQVGTPNTHQFTFPAGGSDLEFLIRETTGAVRLLFQTPTSGTFFVDLPALSSPTLIGGLPEEAGTYVLTMQNLSGPAKTYSLEARFVDGDFDVSRMTRALSYLGFAQNADGSWGVSRGEDGLLMITAEVLRVLEGYGNSFAPRSAIDLGLNWLKTKQNPDGGFGSTPGTSTAHETALVVLALLGGDPSSPVISSARNFLTTTQAANGCWSNDPYQTALAIRALPGVCRLDVDKNGTLDVATDIVYIARHLLGLAPVPPSFRSIDPSIPSNATIQANIDAIGTALDVDENGAIDVATDVVYIARLSLGLTPAPPSFRALAEFPSIRSDAGITMTVDALCP